MYRNKLVAYDMRLRETKGTFSRGLTGRLIWQKSLNSSISLSIGSSSFNFLRGSNIESTSSSIASKFSTVQSDCVGNTLRTLDFGGDAVAGRVAVFFNRCLVTNSLALKAKHDFKSLSNWPWSIDVESDSPVLAVSLPKTVFNSASCSDSRNVASDSVLIHNLRKI